MIGGYLQRQATVHCQWLDTGAFLLWAVGDNGQALDMSELKYELFAWHELSYYGTALEMAEVDRRQGVVLSAEQALDYFCSPGTLQHKKFEWSEKVTLLQKAARIYREALNEGAFGPDFAKWKAGELGWKLALRAGTRVSDEIGAIAAEAEELGVACLDGWFGQIVAARCEEDDRIREAHEKMAEMYKQLTLAANDHGAGALDVIASPVPDWLDEEDWLILIGWKEDTAPFVTALQLLEPEADADWSLRIVLQDKRNPDVLVEYGSGEAEAAVARAAFAAAPAVADGQRSEEIGRWPEPWMEHVHSRVAREVRKWLLRVPSLEDADVPGRVVERLNHDQAWEFLTEGSLRLAETGAAVLLPAWWESVKKLKPRLKAKVRSSVGSAKNSMFGLDQIVQFDWKVAVGDVQLSEEQYKEIVANNRRLIQIDGKWIQLDSAFISQLQIMMRKVDKNQGLSFRDVLEMHLLGGERSASEGPETGDTAADDQYSLRMEVELNAHLSQMIDQLQKASSLPMIEPPNTLQGTLRKYQLQGASWLAFLRRFGLGACLADDMGLGKTIQFITYLLYLKQNRSAEPSVEPYEESSEPASASVPAPAPALLICPTSVLGNWQKELQRFAPSLRVHLHYGPQRSKGDDFPGSIHGVDLVITSYTLAQMDEAELASVQWSSLCLDEAQNIKNAYTKQSAAIRRFPARHRIAMTGTPVENRLTELWSIFDFINPGYLGGLTEFNRKYVNEIERTGDAQLIGEVQKLAGPFILRRVKKDPAIQLDLPDKNEAKTYISLTPEQSSLYENIVQDVMHKVEHLTGMERRGLILATLTKLKQLCNHPALLLKEAEPERWKHRSNKIERLLEMVQEVRDEGERCLVFTQFVEMGHRLQAIVEEQLGERVPFLHGGVSKAKRDEMIASFQGDRVAGADAGPGGSQTGEQASGVFILSLKAGGIGLNLTAANHVFHFDRWWNPAVENQATDRAFRIGQTRDVQVHKFITLGTLEERIDEMIERKQGLSQQIVGAGENWITEMSTNELRELFALRAGL
jgi:SNF2 family DNA or RNA helicase